MNINWALAGQFFVIWIIVAAFTAPYVGRWLRKRRQQSRSARCAKLETLCDLADEYDSASTTPERQAIYRKAQSLGFTEEDEQNREWEGAFLLDENEQPHKPAA